MKNERSIFFRAGLGNFMIFILPLLVALILTVIIGLSKFADDGPFFYVGVILMALGWCLLVRSKWDQVRRGDILSWGVSKSEMRKLYVASYIFILVGYLVSTFSGRL